VWTLASGLGSADIRQVIYCPFLIRGGPETGDKNLTSL